MPAKVAKTRSRVSEVSLSSRQPTTTNIRSSSVTCRSPSFTLIEISRHTHLLTRGCTHVSLQSYTVLFSHSLCAWYTQTTFDKLQIVYNSSAASFTQAQQELLQLKTKTGALRQQANHFKGKWEAVNLTHNGCRASFEVL